MSKTTKRTGAKGQTQPTRTADEQQPAQLTYWQVDRLVRSVAFDLLGEKEETAKTIILLADEISKHPFDHSHVETIAHLIKDHLFAITMASDEALDHFLETERRQVVARWQ
jgi:hypothetical protein